MTGARGTRATRQAAAGAAMLLLGASLLSACGKAEDPPTSASEAPPAQEEEQPSASDGGGDDGTAAEPSEDDSGTPTDDQEGEDTAWCALDASDLVVLRGDDGVGCEEVEKIFADVENWDYPSGEDGADRHGWDCAIAPGQVLTPSRFTEVPMCGKEDSLLTALPVGSTPLDGFAVGMGDHAFTTTGGVEYAFAVPGSDIVCSIVPAEGEDRGHAGCHGTFEEGAEAEGPGGMEPANTVQIDESGAGFAAFGDPRYHPLGPDGDFADEVPELPIGSVLSAYGVVCQSLEAGTVTCTAGADASMRVSATEHEFKP